ncbi:MAG: PQQ-binding-like beta-propeller repeat protein [Firmicutes bacterium]|nr:PQQ-binding-like beta-propeller repeat protein [Bacillota bacterium]
MSLRRTASRRRGLALMLLLAGAGSLAAPAAFAQSGSPPDFQQLGFPKVLTSALVSPDHPAVLHADGAVIRVPAGAVPAPERFEVLTGPLSAFASRVPAGQRPLFDFAFKVENPRTGTLLGKFAKPVLFSYRNPAITPGSLYLDVSPSGQVSPNPMPPVIRGKVLSHPIGAPLVGWVVTTPVRAPAVWPQFDFNQVHNAVFGTGRGPLARGVSWSFREDQGLPLNSPGIDQSLLGPTVSAIQTNHQFGDPNMPTYVDGLVLGATNTHWVYALNAVNGKVVWARRTVNANMSNPLVADNRVIIGTGDSGFLYGALGAFKAGKPVVRGYSFSGVEAFSLHHGRLLWQVPTVGEVMPTPVVLGSTVYFATGGGHVYAVSLADGHVQWKTAIGSFNNMDGLNWWRNPATGRTEILVGGTDPGYLYALDAATGKVLWKYQPAGLVPTGLGEPAPAVDPARGLVIDDARVAGPGGSNRQLVFALNAATGLPVWTATVATGAPTPPFKGTAVPVIANGTVYLYAPVGKAEVALNEANGQLRWSTPIPGGPGHGGVTVVGNTLLLAHGPEITALDAATGRILKTTRIGGSFGIVDPLVVGRTVFLTSGWGWILARPLTGLL